MSIAIMNQQRPIRIVTHTHTHTHGYNLIISFSEVLLVHLRTLWKYHIVVIIIIVIII